MEIIEHDYILCHGRISRCERILIVDTRACSVFHVLTLRLLGNSVRFQGYCERSETLPDYFDRKYLRTFIHPARLRYVADH